MTDYADLPRTGLGAAIVEHLETERAGNSLQLTPSVHAGMSDEGGGSPLLRIRQGWQLRGSPCGADVWPPEPPAVWAYYPSHMDGDGWYVAAADVGRLMGLIHRGLRR
jgi:hypothetical protein